MALTLQEELNFILRLMCGMLTVLVLQLIFSIIMKAKNTWVDLQPTSIPILYELTTPQGVWEKVIFCRMNPDAPNTWGDEYVWNQTNDLIYDGINNHCQITGWGEWNTNSTCQWIKYPDIFWIGNSFIVVNDIWYRGSHEYSLDKEVFDGYDLGEITSAIKIGGEVQAASPSVETITMKYKITQNVGDSKVVIINEKSLELHAFDVDEIENNNSKHKADEEKCAVISVESLSAGTYNIEVWFNYYEVVDDNNGNNFVATFIIPDLNPRNSYIYM